MDRLLHAAGGALIAVAWPAWHAVPLALGFGIVRESWQRGWRAPWRLSEHAWWEAAWWGVGAACVLAAFYWC